MSHGRKRSIGTHWRPRNSDQRGMGTIAMVVILVFLAVVGLGLFLLSISSNSNKQGQTGDDTNKTDTTDQDAASTEPPFIRIPENSLIYKNSTYGFSFAYPSSFEKLSDISASTEPGGYIAAASSAPAIGKPIGTTGAVLTGMLGVYVFNKDDFKMLIGNPEIFVGPAKTGDDTTWKIVSLGKTTQDIKVGDAFPVKTITSQSGVKVFNFTSQNVGVLLYGRYVFESGDNYVMVTLPALNLPDGRAATNADFTAYNIVGANIASTVRAKMAADAADSATEEADSSTDSTSGDSN